MKKILLGILLLFPLLSRAQEATINSPVAQSKYKIVIFNVDTSGTPTANIVISVQDASNNNIRRFDLNIPGGGTGTVPGLITAMMTVRATETGTDSRKMQFRVLGYLSDQSYLTGVTLVP